MITFIFILIAIIIIILLIFLYLYNKEKFDNYKPINWIDIMNIGTDTQPPYYPTALNELKYKGLNLHKSKSLPYIDLIEQNLKTENTCREDKDISMLNPRKPLTNEGKTFVKYLDKETMLEQSRCNRIGEDENLKEKYKKRNKLINKSPKELYHIFDNDDEKHKW
jgi:hypothetical protein